MDPELAQALARDDVPAALAACHGGSSWHTLHNRALCLEMLQRFEEAEATYADAGQAAQSAAQRGQSLTGIANCRRHRGDRAGNRAALSQARAQSPSWPQAHFLTSAQAVRDNDLETAADHLFRGYGAAMDTDAVDTDSFIDAYVAVPGRTPRTYRPGSATLLDLLYSELDRTGHVKLLHQLASAGLAQSAFLGGHAPATLCFVSQHLGAGSVASNFLPLLREIAARRPVVLWAVSTTEDEVTAQFRALSNVSFHVTRPPAASVAICLDGHTGTCAALRELSIRLAPVQVDYLGYPFTTGSAAIDYKVVDCVTDPEGDSDSAYTERLIRLPCCMWTWSPPVHVLPAATPQVSHGSILVCQNFKKVRPAFLACCDRLLRLHPAATIHFRCTLRADAADVFRDWILPAFAPGARARVALVESVPIQDLRDNLAGYHLALDTWPYNGTVTTIECMHAGLPVVTLAQGFHRGRTGCSILTACGLSGYVATTQEEYVDTADAVLSLSLESLEELHRRVAAGFHRSDIVRPATLATAFLSAMDGLVKCEDTPGCSPTPGSP